MSYAEVYSAWKADPEGFWMREAEKIDWDRKPSQALSRTRREPLRVVRRRHGQHLLERRRPPCRGRARRADRDHPRQPRHRHSKREITYMELRNRVASLAGALRAKGVEKGDRVIIYMPMIPEALEAMLACARLGAIHSVVFGGFAANELAVRIDDAKPKAIIAASCGIEPGPRRPLQAPPRRRDRAGDAQARLLRHLPARAGGRPARRPAATSTGTASSTASNPPNASRSRATTPPTSSTPPAPRARPRASCAPPRAISSRSTGR